jgi:hypothetical protein
VAVVVGSWPLIAEAQVQSSSFPLSLSFRQCSILIHQSLTFLLNNTYKEKITKKVNLNLLKEEIFN